MYKKKNQKLKIFFWINYCSNIFFQCCDRTKYLEDKLPGSKYVVFEYLYH